MEASQTIPSTPTRTAERFAELSLWQKARRIGPTVLGLALAASGVGYAWTTGAHRPPFMCERSAEEHTVSWSAGQGAAVNSVRGIGTDPNAPCRRDVEHWALNQADGQQDFTMPDSVTVLLER